MSNENNSFWDGGAKTMFFTGLFLGIALTAILALIFAFGSLFNGKLPTAGAYAPTQPTQPSQPTQPNPTYGPVKAVDAKVDHVLGKADAKVTLIEYSDFQCPFCQRHLPTIKQLMAQYPNDIKLVYRHYPLSQIHPQAQKAAEASECVAKIGGNDKFWQMHDKLFENQATLGTETYKRLAGEVGVDVAKFTTCLDSGEMAGRVSQDYASGNDAGVSGTPATFVNGTLFEGAQDITAFQPEISRILGK
ncbi:DsbA family protein [Candidatus Uhrbacteria bacterium]|nr:DsbA family protein [Candidatus Uhrbacteria bacterium]